MDDDDEDIPDTAHDIIRSAVLDAADAIRKSDDVKTAHLLLYEGAKAAAKLLAK